jgi:tRNA G18 (ribose-2'-O)-methylase SpoU
MRSRAGQRIWLGLEGLADPDNVGSCFRNAAAFGVGVVLLDERCADPLYRKAIRTSMAATLQVPFARAVGWDDVLDECRSAGRVVVGLTPSPGAQDLASFARDRAATEPMLLLAGSEGRGLDEATMSQCDRLVRIPIAPEVDSLNVATAAGIALHALSAAEERG